MAYYTEEALSKMGFLHLGENVKISERASIYDPEKISIGSNSRIDDFCVVSGNVTIGINCHLTPMVLVAGGAPGVSLSDFSTLAYGSRVFAQSDDYSGETMTNSTVPREFKRELFSAVSLGRHVIVGAGATIFPGVDVAEGCAIGAMSLVTKSTQPWGIYAGVPARRIKARSQALLELEKQYFAGVKNDSL